MSAARFLSASDVAAELAISVDTAREYIRTQMIHHRAGKHLRVTRQAFEAYLKRIERCPEPDETTRSISEAGSGGAASATAPGASSASRPDADQPTETPMNTDSKTDTINVKTGLLRGTPGCTVIGDDDNDAVYHDESCRVALAIAAADAAMASHRARRKGGAK